MVLLEEAGDITERIWKIYVVRLISLDCSNGLKGIVTPDFWSHFWDIWTGLGLTKKIFNFFSFAQFPLNLYIFFLFFSTVTTINKKVADDSSFIFVNINYDIVGGLQFLITRNAPTTVRFSSRAEWCVVDNLLNEPYF